MPDSLAGEYFNDIQNSEDISPIYDRLSYLFNNPIDLNNCDENELLQIPFIDYKTASLIMEYKAKQHLITSKTELYGIEGINISILNNSMPYIFASASDFSNEKFIDTTSSLIFNNSFQNYFYKDTLVSNSSSLKIVNKLNIKVSNNFSMTYIQAKNQGESFGDFTSYNISYTSKGIIKKIILGDYRLESGQKLLFSNSVYTPHNLLMNSRSNNFNLISQNSTSENNYFKGLAAAIFLNPIDVTLFYSRRTYDARIDTAIGMITSFVKSGLHRTIDELNNEDKVSEKLLGTSLGFSVKNFFNGGVSMYHSELTIPVIGQGTTFNYLSGYYNFYLSKLKIFGETIIYKKYLAANTGLEYIFSQNISYTIAYRRFPTGFYNLHGDPFRQSSANKDGEVGLINTLLFKNKSLSINLSFDQFNIENLQLPTNYHGNDILIYYSYIITRDVSIEGKLSFIENDAPTAEISRRKNIYRIDALASITTGLKLKYRFEFSQDSKNNSTTKGFTFFQDIAYAIGNGIITNFRITYFNKSTFQYENDLQNFYTNSSLQGEGFKWYILAKYQINKNFYAGIKYIFEMNNLFAEKDRSIINLQADIAL